MNFADKLREVRKRLDALHSMAALRRPKLLVEKALAALPDPDEVERKEQARKATYEAMTQDLVRERDEMAAENEKLLARRGIKKYMALEQQNANLREALREIRECVRVGRSDVSIGRIANKALGEEES